MGESVAAFVHAPKVYNNVAPFFSTFGQPEGRPWVRGWSPGAARSIQSAFQNERMQKLGAQNGLLVWARRSFPKMHEKTNFLQREPTQSEFHCAFENELFVQARKPFWSTWARSRLACGALGVTRGSKMRL